MKKLMLSVLMMFSGVNAFSYQTTEGRNHPDCCRACAANGNIAAIISCERVDKLGLELKGYKDNSHKANSAGTAH